MVGNTFGYAFKLTSYGESHGKAVGCIVDGCPANLELCEEDIQKELDRRRPGGRLASKRKEEDRAVILSGVLEGKTLGTPISIIVENKDVDSKSYEAIKHVFRPGHADYTYYAKYGIRDWRGGGRASARETVARVAAGAIAKKILDKFGIRVVGYTKEIGGIACDVSGLSINEIREKSEKSVVRCPDEEKSALMEKKILETMKEKDSVGGVVEVIARNVPAGLGEPVFLKLDAYLAFAIMGVPAVKGVEIGAGFKVAKMKGSENNDPIVVRNDKIAFETNNAGGVLGGISNGDDIVVRAAIKPTPSISKPQKTVSIDLREEIIEIKGKHDPCIVPRAVPVIEAMVALVIVDLMLLQGLIPKSF